MKTEPLYKNGLFQKFVLVMLLIIIGWLFLSHLNSPSPAPVGMTVAATPAKETKSAPKVTAQVKKGAVRVYAHPIKLKLKLPEAVIQNEVESVVSSTQVKGDDHPQTTTTTLNLDTGEFQTYTRRDPYPWLAWDDHGKVGMYGGYKNGQPTVRIEAEQGIFQVKAVHVGVKASVDQEINPSNNSDGTDYFIGAGAWYRW
jgi:hypothetical protein